MWDVLFDLCGWYGGLKVGCLFVIDLLFVWVCCFGFVIVGVRFLFCSICSLLVCVANADFGLF